MHARPTYRPGLRRRLGHVYDLGTLLTRSGLLLRGSPLRAPLALEELRTWGTSLAGLAAAGAAWTPKKTMIIDDRVSLTWAEVAERSRRLAAGLPLSGPRPRVAVMCRNHHWMVETLIACSRRGAETVLLNTASGSGQLRAVLAEIRVDVIVADTEFAPLLRTVPPALRPAVIWTDAPDATRAVTVDGVIEGAPDPGDTPPPVQGRTIMMSSGTTGRPKGARRPPKPGLWPLASIRSRVPFHSRDTLVIEAPLFHTWGYAALQIGLALRCPIALHGRFSPQSTLRTLQEHRRTALVAVPVMLQRIMELPAEIRTAYDTSSLRLAAVSGSAMPGGLATDFMDAFGDVLYNVYGSTEASWVSIATPRDLRTDPACAGRPPRNTSLVILDDLGRHVGRNVIGRVFAANELLFEGYTSGEPLEAWEGLLATGDLGHLDSHGLLHVDGRSDGLVVSGGENVVPRDVEDLLARLPEIREVAVCGVPDEEYGQRLAAYIVPVPGAVLDAETIRSYVRDQVATFAAPRDVYFLDALPRNALGKVVHRWLAGVERSIPAATPATPAAVPEPVPASAAEPAAASEVTAEAAGTPEGLVVWSMAAS